MKKAQDEPLNDVKFFHIYILVSATKSYSLRGRSYSQVSKYSQIFLFISP